MAKTGCDVVDEREKRRRRRADWTKAVLMMSQREGLTERWLDEALKDLHRRAEEADWTVGKALICRFPRLENWNNSRRFPNCRDLSISH